MKILYVFYTLAEVSANGKPKFGHYSNTMVVVSNTIVVDDA